MLVGAADSFKIFDNKVSHQKNRRRIAYSEWREFVDRFNQFKIDIFRRQVGVNFYFRNAILSLQFLRGYSR